MGRHCGICKWFIPDFDKSGDDFVGKCSLFMKSVRKYQEACDKFEVYKGPFCKDCKHFIPYSVEYEDPLEPNDCGYCNLYPFNERFVSEDTKACDKFEPINKKEQ